MMVAQRNICTVEPGAIIRDRHTGDPMAQLDGVFAWWSMTVIKLFGFNLLIIYGNQVSGATQDTFSWKSTKTLYAPLNMYEV